MADTDPSFETHTEVDNALKQVRAALVYRAGREDHAHKGQLQDLALEVEDVRRRIGGAWSL